MNYIDNLDLALIFYNQGVGASEIAEKWGITTKAFWGLFAVDNMAEYLDLKTRIINTTNEIVKERELSEE